MSNSTKILREAIGIGTKDKSIVNVKYRKLFHPYRILIMKFLSYSYVAEFKELKESLDLKSGTLASHLRTLINEELIEKQKEVIGDNIVKSYYKLSPKGHEIFTDFTNLLSGVFKHE